MTAITPSTTTDSAANTLRERWWLPAGAGAVAGLLAGLLYYALVTAAAISPMMSPVPVPSDFLQHLLMSVGAGMLFAFTAGGRVQTLGGGVMWGAVYGLLWWLAGPMTLFPLLHGESPQWTVSMARAAYPLLPGLVVIYGIALGTAFLGLRALLRGRGRPRLVRSVVMRLLAAGVSGGVAGVLGGIAFGYWMAQVDFYPLVAGLVRSDDAFVGLLLHILISIVIGISYGMLFQPEIHGLGSSLGWGFAYGMIWWFLGPLTIMPLLFGDSVQWSLEAMQGAFPSLIGHVIYGLILGFSHYLLSRIWAILFIDSDPLNREPEGPGTRSLRALGIGTVASIIGGLLFTFVMVGTNALPIVGMLVGMQSAAVGFAVHMVISALIGMSYGLLFRREVYNYGSGLAWGLVYGLIWWFLGPLTIMPLLLGSSLQWELPQIVGSYPSLIGHLVYGAALALVYHLLTQRFDPAFRTTEKGRYLVRSAGTPVAALWVLTLVLSVLLPLLAQVGR
jgi:uncharacterized membrane protein YagU involved in acid resistance